MNVLTVGCFDMLHKGHMNLFRAMREYGDQNVVGLHDDRSIWLNKGQMPVQSYQHRAHNLMLCGGADRVVMVVDADPSFVISGLLAGGEWVYVRGDDWPDFPGRAAVEKAGARIVLVPYTKDISSAERRPCR